MPTQHDHRPEHHPKPHDRDRQATQRRSDAHDADVAHSPATAGVETDTRWGDAEEAFDISGHVLRTEVVSGGSRITISRGRADGIHVGMEGYVRAGDRVLGTLQVVHADKRSCTAIVDVRAEDLRNVSVVVNPAEAIVPAARDRRASIVRVTVGGDGLARIVIAAGAGDGLAVGMAGHVLGDAGQALARFELERVDARSSVASVAMSPDALQRHSHVSLNPTR
jgi:hypothetical protein